MIGAAGREATRRCVSVVASNSCTSMVERTWLSTGRASTVIHSGGVAARICRTRRLACDRVTKQADRAPKPATAKTANSGVAQMAGQPDREKALGLALAQIDKQFGKGSVMRLGERPAIQLSVIPT